MIATKLNRAISIRQPYVEMILQGIKTEEYRSRLTHIRGPVYLYASLKPGDPSFYDEYDVEPGSLPTGLIVGIVEIVGCTYRPRYGDYAYQLANPKRLKKFIKPTRQPQPRFFKPFNF